MVKPLFPVPKLQRYTFFNNHYIRKRFFMQFIFHWRHRRMNPVSYKNTAREIFPSGVFTAIALCCRERPLAGTAVLFPLPICKLSSCIPHIRRFLLPVCDGRKRSQQLVDLIFPRGVYSTAAPTCRKASFYSAAVPLWHRGGRRLFAGIPPLWRCPSGPPGHCSTSCPAGKTRDGSPSQSV